MSVYPALNWNLMRCSKSPLTFNLALLPDRLRFYLNTLAADKALSVS